MYSSYEYGIISYGILLSNVEMSKLQVMNLFIEFSIVYSFALTAWYYMVTKKCWKLNDRKCCKRLCRNSDRKPSGWIRRFGRNCMSDLDEEDMFFYDHVCDDAM